MEEETSIELGESHLLQVKHTPTFFREEVEKYVSELDMSYMDSILMYCEKHEFELEVIQVLMKGNAKIKAALQEEAENLNFLEKTDRLPI